MDFPTWRLHPLRRRRQPRLNLVLPLTRAPTTVATPPPANVPEALMAPTNIPIPPTSPVVQPAATQPVHQYARPILSQLPPLYAFIICFLCSVSILLTLLFKYVWDSEMKAENKFVFFGFGVLGQGYLYELLFIPFT